MLVKVLGKVPLGSVEGFSLGATQTAFGKFQKFVTGGNAVDEWPIWCR